MDMGEYDSWAGGDGRAAVCVSFQPASDRTRTRVFLVRKVTLPTGRKGRRAAKSGQLKSPIAFGASRLQAMKSYIWLQTADGSIQQVEEEVAMFCPMICREIQTGMGTSKNYAISLPERVNPAILSLILDYCRFHQLPGRSNKERKSFDEKFTRIDTKRLCELTSAADSLKLKPLVDLTSRALARMIEGKTPEEIRETFHLPDDLTEEEKLEPLRNTTDDPRIRLLNRLYAKKRKELKERQKLKEVGIEEQQVEEHVDERSVDDLLSFINGDNGARIAASGHRGIGANRISETVENLKLVVKVTFDGPYGVDISTCLAFAIKEDTNRMGDGNCGKDDIVYQSVSSPLPNGRKVSKGVKVAKNKKKNRRKKDQSKDSSVNSVENHEQGNGNISTFSGEAGADFAPSPSRSVEPHDVGEGDGFVQRDQFEDADIDDELDPAMKEELDREVEDFARRLNSDWPERMQQILSVSQESRLLPLSVNGNGSLRRYTGIGGLMDSVDI
ncbi:hypothetical protein Taro_045870 [Colocasia esculenta]|uniref:SKP1-like protein 21 n=1 Tax=Colocasia esculenta TaxID=4460 RepID=A0A843X4U4_COLES|nr:hypothetical protein [Colocasia esculenta]